MFPLNRDSQRSKCQAFDLRMHRMDYSSATVPFLAQNGIDKLLSNEGTVPESND